MKYDQAISQMKLGRGVRRENWSEKKHLYLITGQQFQNAFKYGYGEYIGEPTFISQIVEKTTENNLVVGWRASEEDAKANDWEVCNV